MQNSIFNINKINQTKNIVLIVLYFAFVISTLFSPLTVLGAETTFTTSLTTTGLTTLPPSIPSNLIATAVSHQQIDLSWTASVPNYYAIGGYRIFRDSIFIATTTSTSYSDTGLSPVTGYSYNVEAFDTLIQLSGQSATAYATTTSAPTPTPTPTSPPGGGGGGGGGGSGGTNTIEITNINIIPGTNQAEVRFTTSIAAQTKLQWGFTTDFEIGTQLNAFYGFEHSQIITGLSEGLTYKLRINANGANGASTYKDVSFTTVLPVVEVGPLPNPTNFVAEAKTDTIELTWTNPTDPRFNDVRIVRTEGFYPIDQYDGIPLYEGDGESYTDTTAKPGVTYYYAIFSRDRDLNYSSGALAQARIALEGEIATPAIIDPFANIPQASNVDPMFKALRLSDFEFIQDGRNLANVGETVAIHGDKNLTIRLQYNKVPKILKTIAFTLKDPTDANKVFPFLLRANADRTYYEATIGALGRSGRYGMSVAILDYENNGLVRLNGTLAALAFTPWIDFTNNFDLLGLLILFLLILLIILAIAMIRKWARNHPDYIHTNKNPDRGFGGVNSKKAYVSIVLLIIINLAIFGINKAQAGINQQINYQGKLTTALNAVVPDGSYNIRFKLYTTRTGGAPIWTETWCNTSDCAGTGIGTDDRITISNGLFSTMLGSTTALTGIDFNQTLYLGVEIGGSGSVASWDGEMSPRKILGAVPAAFVAEVANTLSGLNSSQFLRSDAQNATSSATTFINVMQSGAGKIAEFFGSASQSVLSILSNGNVGIGTSTPYSRLSVAGTVVADNFVATSTTASTFPYASSTALTVSGTNGLQLASGLNGPLQAVNGLVSSTSTLSISYGGTGLSTAPSYGQVLLGNAMGGYTLTATSSLGIDSGWDSLSDISLTKGYFVVGDDAGFAQATSSLFVSSVGNVGIGSTSPTSKLVLNGGSFTHTASGNPTSVGTYDTSGSSNGVYVSGKYAYVADGTSGLQIIDISNPSSPTLVGTYDTSGSAYGIYVSGKFAYVGDATSGLQIIDISNPSSPTLAGTYDTSGSINQVYVSGKYAYVADGAPGLQIIDISNPSSPTLVGTYSSVNNISGVYIFGKYAYLADNTSGLQIIDISNPSSPTLAGTYDTSGFSKRVYVSGKYAYVADSFSGLQIIDISNPSSPTLVGTYDTSGNSWFVHISGKYAYVADATSGLQIIDISNPSSPTLVGTYDTSGSANGIYIYGKYAYVADGASGLQVIDINGIETPSLYAGSIQTNVLNVTENADIANNLLVRNGLNVGTGGIFTDGSLAVTGTTSSYIAYNLGIGTTSPFATLSVAGFGSFDNYVRASYFTATSTTATSTFPNLSLTNLLFGSDYLTDITGSGLSIINNALTVTGISSSTLANTLASFDSVGNLIGSSTLSIGYGGTGLSTAPSYGQVLLGNSSGSYDLIGTSSLGIIANLSSVSGTLGVANGGTGASTFGQGWIYTDGGTGALNSSTSPTVNYITATSTTATSTFAGGLSVAGSTGLNVLQNGKVGVGTASPIGSLDISSGNVAIFLGADGSANTRTNNTQKIARVISAQYSNSANGATVFIANNTNSSNDLYIGGGSASYNAVTGINFYTGANTGTAQGTIRMAINNTGNVGVGSTTPWAQLSVNPNGITGPAFAIGSSTKTDFIVTNGGNVGIGTANPSTGYALTVNGDIDLVSRILAGEGSSASPSLTFRFGSGEGIFHTGNSVGFSTLSLERMRISSTGNVGIGTTSPYAKLSVVGETVSEYFTATSTTATSTFPNILATNLRLTGSLYDSTNSAGTNGYVLQSNGTTAQWVSTSSLNIAGGSSLSGGTDGMLASWTGASTLTATGTPTAASYFATSTTATSTFLGGLSVAGESGLTVMQNGKVGVGTNNPMTALEVIGDITSKGTSWTTRSAVGNNDYWRGVVYGNGLFVAVGFSGDYVMTSPDGVNWTARSAAGNDDAWMDITYGNGLFVAVGNSGDRVMTSPDGINWTARSAAGNNDNWRGVAYGNGMFVAVSNSGDRVMTSPDGVNWTARSAAGNNDEWYSVTYGNGLFVAVGSDVGDRVMTSPDGITWTPQSAVGDNDGWLDVVYGNGGFVAIGSGPDKVMTSPDGINWTASDDAGSFNSWNSITYGNGLFVAVGASGADRVMTSPDGVNWTARSAAGNDDEWYGTAYGNGVFVIVGSFGDRVITSGKIEETVLVHNNLYQGGMNIYGNVGIGTTSPFATLSVTGFGSFDNYVRASYFTATSTTATSTFPNLSLTNLLFGTDYLSDITGSGLSIINNALTVTGISSSTLANTLASFDTSGNLVGSSTLSISYGGTGLSTAPSYGQVLLGNSLGGYTLTSTTSLGIGSGWDALSDISLTKGYFVVGDDAGLAQATSSLFVSSTGNIGIGSTSPYAKLSIQSPLAGTTELFSVSTSSRLSTLLSWPSASTTPNEYVKIASGGNSVFTGKVINPTIVGGKKDNSLLAGAQSVYVFGDYAYMANNTDNSLRIINIASTTSPYIVGGVKDNSLLSAINDVYVEGNYAYVVSRTDDSLRIIDVTNPSSPSIVGGIKDSSQLDNARAVSVSGKYAYVVSYTDSSLRVIDISNPISPKIIGGIKDASLLNGAGSLYVSGKYAYVGNVLDNSLRIIDITNPTSPYIVGGIKDLTLLDGITSVHVSGNYAYVTDNNQRAFRVIDISNPASPSIIGNIVDTNYFNNVQSVFVSGKYAYVASSDSDYVVIIDISNPVLPLIVSVIQDSSLLNGAISIFVSGQYAYVANSADNSLRIIDVGGVEVSNLYASNVETDNLLVNGSAQFGQSLSVRGGLSAESLNIRGAGSFTLSTSTSYSSTHANPQTALLASVLDNNSSGISNIATLLHGGNLSTTVGVNGIGSGLAFASIDANGSATSTSQIASIFTNTSVSTPASALSFSIKNISGSLFEALRIDSTGNVGIGTTSPYAKLSVVGETVSEYFTATSTTATSTFPNILATNLRLTGSLYDSTNSAGINGYVLQSNGTTAQWVSTSSLNIAGGSGLSGGTAGMLASWTGASTLTATGTPTAASYFATSTTATSTFLGGLTVVGPTGLNVLQNGTVGIGTNNPMTALEVIGDITSKGTSWIARSAAGNDDGWFSVTYGNGLFVAVGNSGDRVMTSPDGINWTARSAAGNDDAWLGITYGNGLFVAVGNSGDRVMTSPDGINWTARSAAGNDDAWIGITYGNGKFVAVAYSGDRVMTSSDGITWTIQTAADNDDNWRAIAYGNGLFVAVGHLTGDRVMTSPDGVTWTPQSAAGNNDSWQDVTYGNGIFVAVSESGDRVITSSDGVNWSVQNAVGNNDYWQEVVYGNGLFVAVGYSGDRVMTSPDGINWTVRSAAGNDDDWFGAAYGNGLFVAVGATGDRVMTSGKTEETVLVHNNLYQGGMNIYGNVGIGTTSPFATLSVAGFGSFDNYVRASYFTATSTTATSTFPNLSLTNLLFGSDYLTDITGSGLSIINNALTVTGISSSTLANTLASFDSVGNLVGSSTLSISYGGTGLSTAPSYGQVLLGNATGGYTLTSTTSLGFASGWDALSDISLTKGYFVVGDDAGLAQATSSLFVSSLGNIGIGSTSPYAKLSVVASPSMFWSSTTPDMSIFSVASSSRESTLYGYATSTPNEYFRIAAGGDAFLTGKVLNPIFLAETRGPIPGTSLNGAKYVFVSGKYAYVTSDQRNSLAVIDISNPNSPTFVAETQGPVPDTSLYGASSVFVSGKYAYVTNYGRDSLAIIDISNPFSPTFISETRGPTPGTSLDNPFSVSVSGKYAYVTNYNRDSLAVIDISNPAVPTFVAETRGSTPGTSLDGASSVFVSGGYAYVTNYSRDSLAVIDISNPVAPIFVAETRGPTPGTSLDGARSVFVSGKYAYVANLGRDSVAVIDISNPAVPTFVAETRGPTPGTSLSDINNIFVSGKYAYVANTTRSSFAILDISNPNAPLFITETRGPEPVGTYLGNASSVFVSGKYAYVTTGARDSLAVIDVGGAEVSNLYAGGIETDNLQVNAFAQLNQGLLVRGGINTDGGLFSQGQGVFTVASSTNFSTLNASTSLPFAVLSANIIDTNSSSITDALSLSHGAWSSSANNIGVGIGFALEAADGFATSTGRIASIMTGTSVSAPTSALSFSIKNSNIGLTEALRIDSTGNIGIGTTTPWAKLSVGAHNGGTGPFFAIASSSTGVATSTLFVVNQIGNIGIGTTSPFAMLSVAGIGSFDNYVRASYFTATSTTASTFPYASTTALTVAGTNGLQLASGLNGPLQAVNGLVSSTSTLSISYGGTGTSTAPTYGKILIGNNNGGYDLTSTSSLGILASSAIGLGSQGFIPYYAASEQALTATSSVFLAQNSFVGIGTTTPTSALSVFSASAPQFQLAYNKDNYLTAGVSSSGGVTLAVNGAAGGLTITNPQPTAVVSGTGTAAPNSLQVNGATGGNSLDTNIGVGGIGGGIQFTAGIGGTALLATFSETGGAGGAVAVTGGIGGAAGSPSVDFMTRVAGQGGQLTFASGAGGDATNGGIGSSNTAGAGGKFVLKGGIGGNASGATSNTGGNGGSLYIAGGAGGTGSTANGSSGDVYLGYDSSSSIGNVYFGNQNVSYIGSTGNLGIGTTTPWAQLSVNPNGITGPAFAIGSSTKTDFIVTNAGNVGIGTANPSNALHVSAGTARALRLQVGATGYAEIGIDNLAPNWGLGLWFNGTQQAHIYNQGISLGGYTHLDPPAGGIIASGNVGIGTSSPYAKLSVVGQTVSEYFTATSTTATSTFPNILATNLRLTGSLYDSTNSAGTNGYVLQSNGTTAQWVSTSSLNIAGGSGLSGGTAGMLASWTGASTLTATGTPTAAAYFASSTTATSTFAGGMNITGSGLQISANTRIYQNGFSFLYSSTSPSGNLTVGYQAAPSLDENGGLYSTFIGQRSGATATSSYGNTAVGYESLANVTVGTQSVSYDDGLLVTEGGIENVAMGDFALAANTYGFKNVGIGSGVLTSNTTGFYNIGIGASALGFNETGYSNIGIGASSLNYLDGGNDNISIGDSALKNLLTGSSNIAIGSMALEMHESGDENIVIGDEVMRASTSGSASSTIIGTRAASLLDGGVANTFLGYQSGTNVTTGSYNILIGQNVEAPSATVDGQLNIGNVLYGSGMYDGVTSSLSPTSLGRIGVGSTTPWAQLSVNPNGITGPAFAIGSSTKTDFVVTNGGNVGIGTANPTSLLYANSPSGGKPLMTFDSAGNTRFSVTEYGTLTFAGVSYGSVGTAGSPTYTFTSRSTDGMYSPASNILGFSTNGTEKLRISSAGNVGVGTSTPSAKLSIHANNDETNISLFTVASSTASATTTLFTVLNSGRVGIGKVPGAAYELDVEGDIAVSGGINGSSHITMDNTSAAFRMRGGMSAITSPSNGKFYFSDNTFTGNGTLVASSLGLGTTSPYAKLSVVGETVSEYFTATSTTATSTFPNILATNLRLTGSLYDSTNSAGTNGYVLQSNGTTAQWVSTSSLNITGGVGGGWDALSDISLTKGYFVVGDDAGLAQATSSLFVSSIGSLGLGSTTPWAQLSVNPNGITGPAFAIGSSTATKFIVDNGGNVGINTSAPSSKLTIKGDGTTTGRAFAVTDSSNADKFVVLDSGNVRLGVGAYASATKFEVIGTASSASVGTEDEIKLIRPINGLEYPKVASFKLGKWSSSSLTSSSRLDIALKGGANGTYDADNTIMSLLSGLSGVSTDTRVGIGSTTPWAQLSVNPNGISGPAFAIGSSTKTDFIVTSQGRVGIGVTAPTSPLDVNGAISTNSSIIFAGSRGVLAAGSGSNAKMYSASGGDFYFIPDDANGLVIRQGGNVGIGTTSPYAKLSVVGETVSTYFTATSTIATSTFAGGLNVGQGNLVYDFTTGITSVNALETGNLNFETDAGAVSWADLPISSAPLNSVQSYTAQIGGTGVLTIFGLSNGSGGVATTSVAIGTSTPYTAGLTVWGRDTLSSTRVVDVINNASTSLLTIYNGGAVSIGGSTSTTTINGYLDVLGTGTNSTSTISSNLWVKGTLRANLSYVGDLIFANNFAFTEALPINSTTTQGLYLNNQNGDRVLAIDDQGNLNIAGDICARNFVCFNESLDKLSEDLGTLASSTEGLGGIADSVNRTSSSVQTLADSIVALDLKVDAFIASSTLNIDSIIASTTLALASSTDFINIVSSTTANVLSSNDSFVQVIANSVKNILASTQDWVVERFTAKVAYVNRVEAETVAISKGMEIVDQTTGSVWCVTIKNGDWNKVQGTCSAVASTTPIATPAVPEITPNPSILPTPTPSITPVISTPATTSPDNNASSTATTTTPVTSGGGNGGEISPSPSPLPVTSVSPEASPEPVQSPVITSDPSPTSTPAPAEPAPSSAPAPSEAPAPVESPVAPIPAESSTSSQSSSTITE